MLFFFTGSEDVPSTGYDVPPSLMFNHTENPFPTASTCAVQLILPTINSDNQTLFCDKVTYALTNHGGYGVV